MEEHSCTIMAGGRKNRNNSAPSKNSARCEVFLNREAHSNETNDDFSQGSEDLDVFSQTGINDESISGSQNSTSVYR